MHNYPVVKKMGTNLKDDSDVMMMMKVISNSNSRIIVVITAIIIIFLEFHLPLLNPLVKYHLIPFCFIKLH